MAADQDDGDAVQRLHHRIEELEASERLLHSVAAAAPCVIAELTLEGGITYMSRIVPGLDIEEVKGTSIFDYTEPEFHETMRACLERVARTGEPSGYETAGVGAYGRRCSYETSIGPILEGDRVVGLSLMSNDVTARIEMEGALREAQERLAVAVSAGQLGLWRYDVLEDRSVWDQRALEIFGLERPPSGYDEFLSLIHPDDLDDLKALVTEVIENGEFREMEARHVLPSGEVRTVHTTIRPLRNDEGRVVSLIGAGEDVTERRRLEARVQQTTKMEAIGRLAGGVAHDFNNLLTVMMGNARLIEAQENLSKQGRADLEQLLSAAERAADLTRNLLAFARQQILRPQIVNLNEIVRGTEKMLTRLIPASVSLDLRLADDLLTVKADPSQLEQVITNLVVNAKDAMPDGGTITISTENRYLKGETGTGDLKEGDYVFLEVRDTGTGIDADTLAHVFEPFFTTKDPNRGTGLGLSTVHGVVRQSGGNITVESQVGIGSAFAIYLPACAESSSAEYVFIPDIPANERGSGTVLVVEDDDMVRRVAVLALKKAGYRVHEASCGEVARQVFARHASTIDLILSDLIMPGEGGRSFCQWAMAQKPGVRVMFMTGYSADAVGGLSKGVRVLQKPLTATVLQTAVAEMLGSP